MISTRNGNIQYEIVKYIAHFTQTALYKTNISQVTLKLWPTFLRIRVRNTLFLPLILLL